MVAEAQVQPASFETSCFVTTFLRLDEEVFKPFLIRKYSAAKTAIEDEYNDLVLEKFKSNEEELLTRVE